MAFAAHKRIQMNGVIAAGGGVTGEIFSFSVCSSDTLTCEALATAINGGVTSWFHSSGGAGDAEIPSWATLTQIRVEAINPDGTVSTSYAIDVDSIGGYDPAGGCGPAITCFAVTLETDEVDSRGKKVRGRFYPPNAGFYPAGSAALSAGTDFGANIAQSGATLITNLNDAGAVVCVASQTGGGINATVTECSADNVVDTIRRRKNSAVGTRGTHSI